jgi:predicted transcriptional regulator
MKYIKNMATILVILIYMAVPVMAQPELPNPGITPNSPFYFIDRMFEVFQSDESVADERASEVVAMAKIAHAKGLEKANQGYEKAMEKMQQKAEKDENIAEKFTWQSNNHLAVLARIREQVPEQAKAGIDRALNESAQSRENGLAALERQNPVRARTVATATLQELIVNTPEAAQEGLQHALETVKVERRDAIQPDKRISR